MNKGSSTQYYLRCVNADDVERGGKPKLVVVERKVNSSKNCVSEDGAVILRKSDVENKMTILNNCVSQSNIVSSKQSRYCSTHQCDLKCHSNNCRLPQIELHNNEHRQCENNVSTVQYYLRCLNTDEARKGEKAKFVISVVLQEQTTEYQSDYNDNLLPQLKKFVQNQSNLVSNIASEVQESDTRKCKHENTKIMQRKQVKSHSHRVISRNFHSTSNQLKRCNPFINLKFGNQVTSIKRNRTVLEVSPCSKRKNTRKSKDAKQMKSKSKKSLVRNSLFAKIKAMIKQEARYEKSKKNKKRHVKYFPPTLPSNLQQTVGKSDPKNTANIDLRVRKKCDGDSQALASEMPYDYPNLSDYHMPKVNEFIDANLNKISNDKNIFKTLRKVKSEAAGAEAETDLTLRAKNEKYRYVSGETLLQFCDTVTSETYVSLCKEPKPTRIRACAKTSVENECQNLDNIAMYAQKRKSSVVESQNPINSLPNMQNLIKKTVDENNPPKVVKSMVSSKTNRRTSCSSRLSCQGAPPLSDEAFARMGCPVYKDIKMPQIKSSVDSQCQSTEKSGILTQKITTEKLSYVEEEEEKHPSMVIKPDCFSEIDRSLFSCHGVPPPLPDKVIDQMGYPVHKDIEKAQTKRKKRQISPREVLKSELMSEIKRPPFLCPGAPPLPDKVITQIGYPVHKDIKKAQIKRKKRQLSTRKDLKTDHTYEIKSTPFTCPGAPPLPDKVITQMGYPVHKDFQKAKIKRKKRQLSPSKVLKTDHTSESKRTLFTCPGAPPLPDEVIARMGYPVHEDTEKAQIKRKKRLLSLPKELKSDHSSEIKRTLFSCPGAPPLPEEVIARMSYPVHEDTEKAQIKRKKIHFNNLIKNNNSQYVHQPESVQIQTWCNVSKDVEKVKQLEAENSDCALPALRVQSHGLKSVQKHSRVAFDEECEAKFNTLAVVHEASIHGVFPIIQKYQSTQYIQDHDPVVICKGFLMGQKFKYRVIQGTPKVLKPAVCKYCNERLSTRLELELHVKEIHRISCGLCNISFKNSLDLESHRSLVHKKKRHKCIPCNRILFSYKGYIRHCKSYCHLQNIYLQEKAVKSAMKEYLNINLSKSSLPEDFQFKLSKFTDSWLKKMPSSTEVVVDHPFHLSSHKQHIRELLSAASSEEIFCQNEVRNLDWLDRFLTTNAIHSSEMPGEKHNCLETVTERTSSDILHVKPVYEQFKPKPAIAVVLPIVRNTECSNDSALGTMASDEGTMTSSSVDEEATRLESPSSTISTVPSNTSECLTKLENVKNYLASCDFLDSVSFCTASQTNSEVDNCTGLKTPENFVFNSPSQNQIKCSPSEMETEGLISSNFDISNGFDAIQSREHSNIYDQEFNNMWEDYDDNFGNISYIV